MIKGSRYEQPKKIPNFDMVKKSVSFPTCPQPSGFFPADLLTPKMIKLIPASDF